MFAGQGHAAVKTLRDMGTEEVKNGAHLTFGQFFEPSFSRQQRAKFDLT
jgi:hypothetical protein